MKIAATSRKKAAIVSGAALALGVATGTSLAYNAAHDNIVLKDKNGTAISALNAPGNAFSMKKTCFGTAGCHGDASASGKAKYFYDDIERHSYHAQLGANEIRGFNPFNPDSPDAFRKGAGPQGKNWVQSPGHVGSW